jgi:hypothetical protein
MKERTKRTKRSKTTKRSRRTRTVKRGGFRYGHSKGHTPIPGEVLISAPRTRTRTKSRKKYF